MNRIPVVALAGPSGSGKSTVATRLTPELFLILTLERYARDHPELSFEQRQQINYDEPDALDLPLLIAHLTELKAGRAVEAPLYDFAQHRRMQGRTERIEPRPYAGPGGEPTAPFIIIEGILALHYTELRPFYDKTIYLDAPEEVCHHRREVRDIVDRQRTREFMEMQWRTMVTPAAQRYLYPSKRYAEQTIDATAPIDKVVSAVMSAILC